MSMINWNKNIYDTITKRLEGKSKDELLTIRENAQNEIERRILDHVDDGFASNEVNEITRSIIDDMLKENKKTLKPVNELTQVVNGFTITLLDREGNINIVNKDIKLNATLNMYGDSIKGAGAKKNYDIICELSNNFEKYMRKNRYAN